MTLIAQITDPHLRDDGADPCHDPAAAMRRAFATIAELELRPDAIVLTGDVIDRSAKGYAQALPLLREAPVPLLPLPGNHDPALEFRRAFTGWAEFAPDHLSFVRPVGGAVLVALDSNLPGGRGGVDAARLDWLTQVLDAIHAPAILALHHPPFPTLVPHLEQGGFAASEELARLVAGGPVRAVIAGHAHRGMRTVWAGVPASTAPAIGYGLTLSLAGDRPSAIACTPAAFELHHLRAGSVVSHSLTIESPLSQEARASGGSWHRPD